MGTKKKVQEEGGVPLGGTEGVTTPSSSISRGGGPEKNAKKILCAFGMGGDFRHCAPN